MDEYLMAAVFYGYSHEFQTIVYNLIRQNKIHVLTKKSENNGLTIEKIKNACRIIKYRNVKYVTKLNKDFETFLNNQNQYVMFYIGDNINMMNEMDSNNIGIVANKVLSKTGIKIMDEYISELFATKKYKVLMYEETMVECLLKNSDYQNIIFLTSDGLNLVGKNHDFYKINNRNVILLSFSPYYKKNNWQYNHLWTFSTLITQLIVVEMRKNSYLNILINICINNLIDIWTFPGNVFSKNFQGNNRLILDGANIILYKEQIIES